MVGIGLTAESLGTSLLSLTVIWKEEVGTQVYRILSNLFVLIFT